MAVLSTLDGASARLPKSTTWSEGSDKIKNSETERPSHSSSSPQQDNAASENEEAFEKFLTLIEQRSEKTTRMLAVLLERREMINAKIVQIREKQEKIIERLLKEKIQEKEAFEQLIQFKDLENETRRLLVTEEETRRSLASTEPSSADSPLDPASPLLPALTKPPVIQYRPEPLDIQMNSSSEDMRKILSLVREEKTAISNIRMSEQSALEELRIRSQTTPQGESSLELSAERIRDIASAENSASETYTQIVSQQSKGLFAQANQNQLRVLQLLK